MRRITSKNSVLSLLFLFLLTWTISADNEALLTMTVQVTLIPKNAKKNCSVALLQALQPQLTSWVLKATTLVVSNFHFTRPLVLTYPHPILRQRGLGMMQAITSRRINAPESCTSCTSSGCSQYCGGGECNLCASSRRLMTSDSIMPINDQVENGVNDEGNIRKLPQTVQIIDFDALGDQVSESVQQDARAFLSNPIVDLGYCCLGDSSSLKIRVKFLVNQAFNP